MKNKCTAQPANQAYNRQINPNVKAFVIRGALYLLLLLTVCVIPFALAQRNLERGRHTDAHLRRPNGVPLAPVGGVYAAWVARYNGPANDFDGGVAIVLDSSGNVYVTGESVGVGTSADYLTLKYNSSGEQEWVTRYDGGLADAATAIAID